MTLRLSGSTSGYVELQAADVAANNTMILPSSGDFAATTQLGPRNKIINGNFDVWQRGTTFTTTVSGTSDYTADRWKVGGGTSTTVSRQAFTLGQTDVPGEPTYYAQWAITNNSQNYEFQQRIEDVRTLAGQKATISFYARRTTGTITVGVRTVQYFGTGGSPSSSVIVTAGTPSLTTDWQKFTYTVDIGSISGKTLGSNNDHSLWVGFQVSDTNTGTIEIAQFQVEAGSVATPFEHRSYGDELARCQRYFIQLVNGNNQVFSGTYFYWATTEVDIPLSLPVAMRSTPSIVQVTGAYYRASPQNDTFDGFSGIQYESPSFGPISLNMFATSTYNVSGSTGAVGYIHTVNANASVALSAEL